MIWNLVGTKANATTALPSASYLGYISVEASYDAVDVGGVTVSPPPVNAVGPGYYPANACTCSVAELNTANATLLMSALPMLSARMILSTVGYGGAAEATIGASLAYSFMITGPGTSVSANVFGDGAVATIGLPGVPQGFVR
jgi:hypothetical protein